MFRALSARANNLAQDRPDIAFCTKELCREFAVPNQSSYMKLKRVVRYLVGLPRLVFRYDWQETPTKLDVYTDSDFAGCKTSRRSTSGGVIMHGKHCLKHWASTQTTLSLSSGESELHGISKGIQQGLGFQSMISDIGMTRFPHWHDKMPQLSLELLEEEDSANCGIWMLKTYGCNQKFETKSSLWRRLRVSPTQLISSPNTLNIPYFPKHSR